MPESQGVGREAQQVDELSEELMTPNPNPNLILTLTLTLTLT